MSASSPRKKKAVSLKDRVASASFAYRDVEISMDGERTIAREYALARVLTAGQDLMAAEAALNRQSEDVAADERMGQKPAFVIELEETAEAARTALNDARAEVEALEAAMRDNVVVLRFTAVKKDRFREIQAESDDASEIYSALARESGRHVNGDDVEDIEPEVWDMLEEAMTAGQWQQVVAALDEVNITLVGQRRDFLGRGSTKTRS